MFIDQKIEGQIPVYEVGTIPNLKDFEEMDGFAIGAYSGGFSRRIAENRARHDAIMATAAHFGIDTGIVVKNYEICIVPGVGFHGRIFARKR